MDEVLEWQSRPLEPMYPLVFFDALRVKIRDEGSVKNKTVYLARGVQPDGTKEILDIWIEQTEGAKFWLRVMTEAEAAAALEAFSVKPVGPEISVHCTNLAAALAGSHSLLCLPAGGTQNHLYHQRHRELEYAGTQGNQEPWPLL